MADSLFEASAAVPPPLGINLWKHHTGFLRRCWKAAAAAGTAGLTALMHQIPRIGSTVMDLYLGDRSPQELAQEILHRLQEQQCLSPAAYAGWLAVAAGYRLLSLSDQSCWVLRLGQSAERYVHVHPARDSPHTCRVRANLLKTALVVLTAAPMYQGTPQATEFVNQVRRDYLHLPPLRTLAEAHQLRRLLDLLQTSPGESLSAESSGNRDASGGQ
jgi:hypothetical protein